MPDIALEGLAPSRLIVDVFTVKLVSVKTGLLVGRPPKFDKALEADVAPVPPCAIGNVPQTGSAVVEVR